MDKQLSFMPTYSQLEAENLKLKARLLTLEYTLRQIGRIAEQAARTESDGYYTIEMMVRETLEGGNK